MQLKFIFLLVGLFLLIFTYIYSVYLLMKNVREEFTNQKFKIFGMGIFTSRKYFNEKGKKYLVLERLIAILLFLYGISFVIYYFSNK